MGNTPHVAIVGAGFGGLGVAEQLDHVLVEVTLIDQHNYHTFQPLLYQVATSLLNAEDVGAPVRSMFRHCHLTHKFSTSAKICVKRANLAKICVKLSLKKRQKGDGIRGKMPAIAC